MAAPNSTIRKIFAPVASLKLTVVLLVLSMLVILAGTTAQQHAGIWQVQEKYFHSFFCWIDLQLLLPLVKMKVPGAIPMLGGYSLIILLLANLVSAHALRFKVSPWDIVLLPMLGFLLALLWAWQNNHMAWLMVLACLVGVGFLAGLFIVHKKRGGIILIHLGLMLLLVGEISTSLVAVESRMTIDEGGASNYSFDIREPELALVDTSSASQNKVYAIDDARLNAGNVIATDKIPFELKIDQYFKNAELIEKEKPEAKNAQVPQVTAGSGSKYVARKRAAFVGVGDESSAVDMPAAYVTISKAGQTLGTFLASTELAPQSITLDGKPYELSLRFRRYYWPFRLELHDFRFDRYTGTDTPKNYSSTVRLVDPARNEDREVTISMNNPLRHAGLTFFQADFDKNTEKTTILQVVRNPGWLIPYVSCVIGAIGLVAHFGIVLVNFLRKRAKQATLPPPAGRATSCTLQPRRNWPAIAFSSAVGVLAVIFLVGLVMRDPEKGTTFDYAAFGQLPISFGGRQQPLDSIARNHLKVLSGREEFKDSAGTMQPATKWLLDVFTFQGDNERYLRIDHSGIKSIIAKNITDPDPKDPPVMERKLFSPSEIQPSVTELDRQIGMAMNVPASDRDLFQQKLLDFSRQFHLIGQLRNIGSLYFVPPTSAGGEWHTLGGAIQDAGGNLDNADPIVGSMVRILKAYQENKSATFNEEVAGYRTMVAQRVPDVLKKTDFETRFNLVAPFVVSMVLYVAVFVLAALSWLTWREPLRRGAVVLLVVTLLFHTLALIGRIYISGRPPVTNLYSSAIFIAWGTAVFALLLELVYRNGIGCAVAAITAFPSLLIAHYLSFSGNGDTMEVLQAVLDTNFWLATHVVAITLGYAATFLAGFLGIVYVVFAIATPVLRDENARKSLSRMVYGILCFAILFSFVGTVLGGIWADQSWGRFWGWDPKENGAVLIVLWNAIILHARWGGIVRERGVAVLAILGNIVTAWSWFGTNMLGVGLHSYGFMDAALFWLGGFIFSQLALILLGTLLPQRFWLSMRSEQSRRRSLEPRLGSVPAIG